MLKTRDAAAAAVVPELSASGRALPTANLSAPQRNRMRAELRAMVNGELLLLEVERLCAKLESGEDSVFDPVTGAYESIPMNSTRVAALGKVLDVRMKMLGKVLPDLKAVELTGENGEPLKTGESSDRMVIATKLLALMRGIRADAQLGVDGVPTACEDGPTLTDWSRAWRTSTS